MVGAGHAFFTFWLVFLLGSQLLGVMRNLTSYESHATRKKAPYFYHTGRFFNPWNRGIVENVREFLMPRRDDWLAVVEMPEHNLLQ